jgi:hypothetical protein
LRRDPRGADGRQGRGARFPLQRGAGIADVCPAGEPPEPETWPNHRAHPIGRLPSQGAVVQVRAADVAKVTTAMAGHGITVTVLGAPQFSGDADIRIATRTRSEVRPSALAGVGFQARWLARYQRWHGHGHGCRDWTMVS